MTVDIKPERRTEMHTHLSRVVNAGGYPIALKGRKA